ILILGVVRLVTDLGNWPLYVIGMLSVSLVFLLLHVLTGGNGLGMGDVKLVAAAGLLLGWPRMILAVLLGSFSGALIHSVRMRRGAGKKLAFGPYLAAGLWFSALFGSQLISAYLSLFGL
ncbi:MAG: prepilin peptidase, partial [Ruminiclostridium sp.]|nr:prepilin peptidase [Ruminiclostridium sp.]